MAKLTDAETAWNQVRELRSLVEEQQSVIRQMRLATVDCAPLSAHAETVRDPIDAPCHAAFMAFLGCEACAELKESMPVDAYMTFVAKKQCREWWVRKSEALLDKVDIEEETPRRVMVSQLWRKFHDVVSTMVLVLPPTCLAAWNVVHRTPTVPTLEVSLSSVKPSRVHGTRPLPPILASCPLGDVALDLIHGYSVLQGSHGLAFRKVSESDCVGTVFQPGCHHFWTREMVTCGVRSPLHCLYCLGPDWPLLQFLVYRR